MTIEAIAVVRIPYAALCATRDLAPARNAAEAREKTAPFAPVGDDGTAVFTGRSFGEDPDEVVEHLATLLAGVEAPERVLLLPDKVWRDDGFAGYEAAVEEAGELGEWVELPQAGGVDLGSVAAMMGGMDSAAMAQQLQQAQQLMAQNPAAAKAAESMMKSMGSGQGDMAAMLGGGGQGGLLGMAQQMLSNMSDEQRASLEQLAQSMMAPDADDEDDD